MLKYIVAGILAIGVLSAGVRVATQALFTDTQAVPDNTFTTADPTTPTGLTANPLGHTVQTSWNAVNAPTYKLTGGTSGTDSACTSVTYSVIASPAVTNYTGP